jgi:hypothetical protein
LKKYPEIGEDLNGFIENVLEWMKKRINSSSNRDGLAIDAIRAEPDVWPGHGIYTTNEIFWLGGTSFYIMPGYIIMMLIHSLLGLCQFLTEAELFNEDDPSRLTRYIVAAWTWDKKGRQGILYSCFGCAIL